MREAARDDSVSLSPSRDERIDQVCDRFEAAWKAVAAGDQRPRLEDYLGDTSEPDRSVLLEELLGLELAYRWRRGEEPARDEYRQRFPDQTGAIDAAFREEDPAAGDTVSMPSPTAPAPDRPPMLEGYEVLEELGRGGMGVVYKARQVKAGRLVALKMTSAGSHATPADLARFRREVTAAARLAHPGIVIVYEVGEQDGLPFFSLEYCPGGSLKQKLDGRPLPPREAAELVATLAGAVHDAHCHQVVHRDLKPANVLLAADGKPKVADFGLAKQLNEPGLTVSGAIVGTPSYMAPEQALGRGKEVTALADVYALGAILYECLTGRPPFQAPTVMDTLMQVVAQEPVPPSRLQPGVPRGLETVCLKCLEKDPGKRYASAAALAEDLRRFLDGRPVLARPVGRWVRAGKWCRRNPAAAGLVAAVTALALGSTVAAIGLYAAWDKTARKEKEALQEKERANDNLALARRAVDEAVTKVAQEPRLLQANFLPLRSALLETAVPFYEAFAKQVSGDPGMELDRARAYARLGGIRALQGQLPRALQAYEQQREILTGLTAADPASPVYRAELADNLGGLGGAHAGLGNRPAAREAFERAVALWEQVVAAKPAAPEHRAGLAAAFVHLGHLFASQAEHDKAQEAYGRALDELRQLAQEYPANLDHRTLLAKTYSNLGDSLGSQGKSDGAEKALEQAVAIFRGLMKDDPTLPDRRVDLAVALALLGGSQANAQERRVQQAQATYQEARDLLGGVAGEFADAPSFRQALAGLDHNMGRLLCDQGEQEQGEKILLRALTSLQQLAETYPTIVAFAEWLGACCSTLGNMLHRRGETAAALEWLNKGISTLEKALARDPLAFSARQHLGTAYGHRGALRWHMGRSLEAAKDFDRAQALDGGGSRTLYQAGRRVALARAQSEHAKLALSRSGRHEEAIAEADLLASCEGVSAAALYNCACVYALASAAAPDADSREKRAGGALALLRRAQALGHFKTKRLIEELKTDKDLDALRKRDDFQNFLTEVAAPPVR